MNFSRFLIFLFITSFLSGCLHDGFLLTQDGVKLYSIYDRVPEEKGTVILLHGLGSSREELADLSIDLNHQGWSTLAFDFRGHGESRGTWGGRVVEPQQLKGEELDHMLWDVDAAVRHVQGEGRVWLLGASYGAKIAFEYAAKHPRVAGVILLSPALDYSDRQYDEAMQQYGLRPLFVAASAEDPVCYKAAEALDQRASGPHQFLRYQNAGHGSGMFSSESELKKTIGEWLEK